MVWESRGYFFDGWKGIFHENIHNVINFGDLSVLFEQIIVPAPGEREGVCVCV